jgi:hypothetical protein
MTQSTARTLRFLLSNLRSDGRPSTVRIGNRRGGYVHHLCQVFCESLDTGTRIGVPTLRLRFILRLQAEQVEFARLSPPTRSWNTTDRAHALLNISVLQ